MTLLEFLIKFACKPTVRKFLSADQTSLIFFHFSKYLQLCFQSLVLFKFQNLSEN